MGRAALSRALELEPNSNSWVEGSTAWPRNAQSKGREIEMCLMSSGSLT